MIRFVIIFIIAYVVGSINFSILLFKILGRDDPRVHFSRNPGAMNVYRQAGLSRAGLVLLLDVGKAMGISYLAFNLLSLAHVPWIGLGLLMGNRFPCFHGFKGGKGVAHYLGLTGWLAPWETLLALPLWLILYRMFRQAFIASFVMVFILAWGLLNACGYQAVPAAGVFISTAFVVFNHKQNILDWWHK